MEELVYSLIQVIHNLNGAVALGLPLFWLWYRPQHPRPTRLLTVLALVWILQGATGAIFGVASFSFYGTLPDLHPIAFAALLLKVVCVMVATVLCLWFMRRRKAAGKRGLWFWLTLLAATALAAAAVLRWNA